MAHDTWQVAAETELSPARIDDGDGGVDQNHEPDLPQPICSSESAGAEDDVSLQEAKQGPHSNLDAGQLLRVRNGSGGDVAVSDSHDLTAPEPLPGTVESEDEEQTSSENVALRKSTRRHTHRDVPSEQSLQKSPPIKTPGASEISEYEDDLDPSVDNSARAKENHVSDIGTASQQDQLDTEAATPRSLVDSTGPHEQPAHESAIVDSIHAKKPRSRKSKQPRAHGGRRGRPRAEKKDGARARRRPSRPVPELVCRRSAYGRDWEIVLVESVGHSIRRIEQNGKPLSIDSNGDCYLPSLRGELVIEYGTTGDSDRISLFQDEPLIFKMKSEWQDSGRRLSRITHGYFIVIVPADWTRIGDPPVEPEGCSDDEFAAHYFYSENGMDDIGRFEQYQIPLAAARIELAGKRILDDSDQGALFVGVSPELQPNLEFEWVRIGYEGPEGDWAENFNPTDRSLANALDGRQGWFFVRVYGDYDGNLRMSDSDQFRYLADLREIRVNGSQYTEDSVLAPSPKGHSPTEIRFIAGDGTNLVPSVEGGQATKVANEGVVLVPPCPDEDLLSCIVGSERGAVDVALHLPRIWWRLERDNDEVGEWCDVPIPLTRKDLQKLGWNHAVVRVLVPNRMRSVRLGFDKGLDLSYECVKRESDDRKHIVIPLDEFLDYAQVDHPIYDDVSLGIDFLGDSVTILRIFADPLPEIVSFNATRLHVIAGEITRLRWETRHTESVPVMIDQEIGAVERTGELDVKPIETTVYELCLVVDGADNVRNRLTVTVHPSSESEPQFRAHVRIPGGGWRLGKGFSRRELSEAYLTEEVAATRSIPLDRRRHSCHRENVERLLEAADA